MKRYHLYLLYTLIFFALSACTQNEIEWILVKETTHFTFFSSNNDRDAVQLLAQALETNYNRITSDLKVDPAVKFPVYIFDDIDIYHKEIGRPDAPASSIGTVQGTAIWLVSPLNPGKGFDLQDILTIGVHEFTHAVVNYINGSTDNNNYLIPIWLNEGLAGYEAGQMTTEWQTKLAEFIANEAIPSITKDLIPDRFEQVKGFPFSITLVTYLIDQYGFEKVIAMIKAPSDMETILGLSLSELESDWHAYLRETYRLQP